MVAGDHGRSHELVGFAAAVGGFNSRHRVLGAFAAALQDRPISLFDPVPALVAIHREIATANGDDPNTIEAGDVALEILQIGRRGLGRGVPPVEKGMDGDRHPGFGEDAGEGGDLPLVRMHAAGRHQPHQMRGPVALFQLADKLAQRRHGGELAVGDSCVDARQVLQYKPSGAEIGVADLGVPHLTVGEPDIMLARLQMRVRPARHAADARPACAPSQSHCRRPFGRSPQPSRMHSTSGSGRE